MRSLPPALRNRFWHSTSPERFARICQTGAILPEPELQDSVRWGTARGPELYPYVRFLGGVSLFDFNNFDERSYAKRFPLSNWHSFVPKDDIEGNKVWLEIDRVRVGESIIEGKSLLQRWIQEEAYIHRLMPEVEAAHIGAIPLTAVAQVLEFSQGNWRSIAIPIA